MEQTGLPRSVPWSEEAVAGSGLWLCEAWKSSGFDGMLGCRKDNVCRAFTTRTTELTIHISRLLDVLAQRKDSGEVYGSILIDGRPQGISFQRLTGYCEQMDVHERTATVREALIFSAFLRQPASVSEEEKLAYVDHIIDLLELYDIRDALIGGKSQNRFDGVYTDCFSSWCWPEY